MSFGPSKDSPLETVASVGALHIRGPTKLRDAIDRSATNVRVEHDEDIDFD